MPGVLDALERSQGIVLASPMNFWTVTALMKRFIERLVCFAYWPWGAAGPRLRRQSGEKRAVLVASSAAPAILARLSTRMVGLLKQCARILGAKPVGTLFIGLAAVQAEQPLPAGARRKARRLGEKLAHGA